MRHKVFIYLRQNVLGLLALFVALGTGSAYAANTVFSSDIVDGEVKSVDIGNGEVGSADVKDNSLNTFDVHSFVGADVIDGSLKDEDVAESTWTTEVNIGVVPAHDCVAYSIPGVNADNDHLVLTPYFLDTHSNLDYTAQFDSRGFEQALIQVCNPTSANVDDGRSTFKLLVIDGQ